MPCLRPAATATDTLRACLARGAALALFAALGACGPVGESVVGAPLPDASTAPRDVATRDAAPAPRDVVAADAVVADAVVGTDVPVALRSCTSNPDCAAHYADYPVCVAGACEPCSASAACDPGAACDAASGHCVPGCLLDTDCHATTATPHCDVASHACVACEHDADCAAGEHCGTAHTCAAGCDATHACGAGATCCAGACAALATDPAECGACGHVCALPNATAACGAGACTVAHCTGAFADCDGSAANGCEVDTSATASSCGACGHACAAGQACTAGACVSTVALDIALSWDVTGDMDLEVVTPLGHTIDFATPSADGGELDHDSMVVGPEHITFLHSAPAGHYMVCVVPYAITGTTHYTVTIDATGHAPSSYTNYRSASSGDVPCTAASRYHVADVDL